MEMTSPLRVVLLLALAAGPGPTTHAEGPPVEANRPIRESDVANLPHPGTVVPGAIGSAPDG